MNNPVLPIRIVMQRRALQHRWADEKWEAYGVVCAEDNEPQSIDQILISDAVTRYLVKGFRLELFRDEVEGYFLNMTAAEPTVFIVWRKEEGQDIASPVRATVSYGEAARAMDASENVDAVPMPREIQVWLNEYVEKNYTPEPKKPRHQGDKPSFQSKR